MQISIIVFMIRPTLDYKHQLWDRPTVYCCYHLSLSATSFP